ncbi:MAG: pseudouridine synthase [Myxococcota bacterium]
MVDRPGTSARRSRRRPRDPRAPTRPARPRCARGARRAASAAKRAGAAEPRPARKLEAAGAPVRLQRLLASAGFGSRREVEALLVEGRVSVNGEVASLGDRARPGVDDIRLDGERVLSDRPLYWIVNKPRGVVTTVRDEAGRRTVIDLLPRKLGRVFPVGRLDAETTGLLLLTNDGETAYAMLHPSLGNEREYRVSVKGQIDAKAIARIEKGVHLEEGKTAPGRVDDVRIDPKTGTSTFTLTLVEGRNRQIRRSLLILGFPVRRLVRERMGPLRLGGLAVGEARALTAEERASLLAHVARLQQGERPRRARPSVRRTEAARPKREGTGPGAFAKPGSGRPVREAGGARSGKPSRPRRPSDGAGVGRPKRGERAQRDVSSRKGVRK